MDGEVLNSIGIQALTVGTSAVALGGVTDKKPTKVRLHVKTSAVRFRADGTAPTSTVGIELRADTWVDHLDGNWRQWIENVQFIRDTGAAVDATVDVEYFA